MLSFLLQSGVATVKPRLDPRVFVALPLSRTAQERIAAFQSGIKEYLHSWHFIHQLNFHVTLRFFGEVPESEVEQIDAACRKCSSKLSAFSLNWRELDFFGSPSTAKVLYLGADGCPDFNCLTEEIQQSFPTDKERKAFQPHVTLAKAMKNMDPGIQRLNANMLRRLREKGRFGPEQQEIDVTTVHREFVLMETIWVGRGVEYEVRQRYPFSAE